MDTEHFEIKTKGNNKKQQNQNSIINKILYLQMINLLLIFLTFFYQNKNNFINTQNKQIAEESHSGTTSEKIKYLKILTNNNENEYKEIQECLLNNPDKKFCIYSLFIISFSINRVSVKHCSKLKIIIV